MKKFSDMHLKTKLMLGFGAVLVLALIISLIAVNALRSSAAAADHVGQTIASSYASTMKSSQDFNVLNNAMAMYLSPGNQSAENKQAVETALTNVTADINALDPAFSPQDVSKLKELAASYAANYNDNIVPLLESSKPFDALSLYMSLMLPAATEITELHANLTEKVVGTISSDVHGLRDNTALVVVIVMAVGAIILGFAIAYIVSNYITRELREQGAVASTIANNDFSVDIPVRGEDEIGQLAKSMRAMRDDLNASVRLVIDTANRLEQDLAEVSKSSSAIGTNAKEVENQSITVAAASDEMVSTTQDIAKNCESAAALSEQSRSITNQGVDVVRATVDDIRNQSLRTQDDAKKIQALADQTVQIGSIVSTIDDIAAQTNLLALNAAIEAARAGEAGRGFAVVADEVRALASRTSKSTQEISQMVTQIQNDANIATQSMSSSVENMNAVAEHAGQLEQTLNDVLNHVNEVNGQITQIATAAEEQTTATSEISSNMQHISSAAQQVSQDAQESVNVVVQAVQSIRELQDNLSRFKLR